jgi:hypothetical protein
MDLLEIGLNVVDSIGLAQDRYRWRVLVNSVIINWKKYREEVANNINLKIMLKNPEDLDLAIETLTKVMQQAALQSTPPLVPHKCMNNTPLEIQQLLGEKKKVNSVMATNPLPNR